MSSNVESYSLSDVIDEINSLLKRNAFPAKFIKDIYAWAHLNLEGAEKFKVPDNGQLLNVDTVERARLLCEMKPMPFPTVAFEYNSSLVSNCRFIPTELRNSKVEILRIVFDADKRISVVKEYTRDTIINGKGAMAETLRKHLASLPETFYVVFSMVSSYSTYSNRRHTIAIPALAIVDKAKPPIIYENGLPKVNFFGIILQDEDETDPRNDVLEVYLGLLATDVEIVHSMAVINSMSNVNHARIPVDREASRKRTSFGKTRLFEYRILTLNVDENGIERSMPSECKGGTHASPACHVRRGHVRRYRDETGAVIKEVWINDMIINPDHQKVVEKQYNLVNK